MYNQAGLDPPKKIWRTNNENVIKTNQYDVHSLRRRSHITCIILTWERCRYNAHQGLTKGLFTPFFFHNIFCVWDNLVTFHIARNPLHPYKAKEDLPSSDSLLNTSNMCNHYKIFEYVCVYVYPTTLNVACLSTNISPLSEP